MAEQNLLEQAFSSDLSNPSDNVKELFNPDNPKVKTDLSDVQISLIARLYYLGAMLKDDSMKALLDEFITLRISKDRKSRSEFVDAHKASLPETRQGGLLNNVMGAFKK